MPALLDRFPPLAQVPARWRAGAEDDMVSFDPLVWKVYEYPDRQDPRDAAMVWLHDLTATMLAAGVGVAIADLVQPYRPA